MLVLVPEVEGVVVMYEGTAAACAAAAMIEESAISKGFEMVSKKKGEDGGWYSLMGVAGTEYEFGRKSTDSSAGTEEKGTRGGVGKTSMLRGVAGVAGDAGVGGTVGSVITGPFLGADLVLT